MSNPDTTNLDVGIEVAQVYRLGAGGCQLNGCKVTLRLCRDVSPAAWLLSSMRPEARLITEGPAGFDCYARLRFISDPAETRARSSTADSSYGGTPDLHKTALAMESLSRFTATPGDVYYCLWDGYLGSASLAVPGAGEVIDFPSRRYLLFNGTLDDISQWGRLFDGNDDLPPAFIWPADRRWCITCDVDSDWAVIGGNVTAIDCLVADSDGNVTRIDSRLSPEDGLG